MEAAPKLLEREGQLDRLRGRLDAAAQGSGSVCLIEGPAGVGKTALLAALALAAGGFAVLSAAAGILEGDLAWSLVRQLFAGVIDAADPERADLLTGAAALAAAPLGLVEGRSRAAGLHGLYWLTAGLSRRSPLLLAVDDAHWGDEPSQRYLAYLGERVADLPVLVAATVRAGEAQPPPLRALAAAAGERIELPELSPAAGARLARAELGEAADEEFCAACHRATAGNPFLLRELLRELAARGVEPSRRGAAAVDGVTPETVKRALLLRLSRLPPEARALAEAAAVLGGEARLAEVAALAGLGPDAAATAADSLLAAGILAPGREIEFAHPLVRDTLYAEIAPHERDRRHAHAARLLDAAGQAPSRVAAQLLETAPSGDAWAVERLAAAAAEAMAEAAPTPAGALLERALAEPPAAEDRGALLVELARAREAAGLDGAAAPLREALALADSPARRAQIALELGRVLFLAGEAAEAAAVLNRARDELAAAGEADGDGFLATALEAAWLAVARVEVEQRAEATRTLRALARRPPAVETYADRALLAQVADQLIFDAEPRERALRAARLAYGDGQLLREETVDGLAWAVVAGVFGWCDEFETCEAICAAATADARRRGSIAGFATASFAAGVIHFFGGRLAEATADAEQALAGERQGWSQYLLATRALLALVLLERGELDAAQAQLDAALAPGGGDSTMRALALEAQARLHLARRRPRQALQAATAAGALCEETAMANPAVCPWRTRAATAAMALGERERAEELIGEAVRLARRFGAPRPLGVALGAAGTIRGGNAGLKLLEEATAVLADSPARLERGRALVLHGAALRRGGRLNAARDRLRAGLDDAAATGGVALEERARAELAAAGARPRRRRISGVEALTPAELRVAELAVAGLTNREIAESLFVSLRTVETHLTHAYRKLGIGSRAELAGGLAAATAAPR